MSTSTDPSNPWATARDLASIGELTAGWLEGSLDYHPSYGGPPDPETDPLITILATFNRSGFVTDFSQPGNIDELGAQRAVVSGYCAEDVGITLDAVQLNSGLIVIALPGGCTSDVHIPVSHEDGRPCTWAVHPDIEHIETDFEGLARDAKAALRHAWYVCVIDPVWGRNDYLWELVADALRGPRAESSFSVWGTVAE